MTKWFEKHLEIINEYCTIIDIKDNAVFYIEDGEGIAEFEAGASFPCSSVDEFEELYEDFKNETFEI